MTDEETLARLRASDMSPGDFLHALESLEETQDLPPMFPALTLEEYRATQWELNTWRWAFVAAFMSLMLALLACGVLVHRLNDQPACVATTAADIHSDVMQLAPTEIQARSREVYEL